MSGLLQFVSSKPMNILTPEQRSNSLGLTCLAKMFLVIEYLIAFHYEPHPLEVTVVPSITLEGHLVISSDVFWLCVELGLENRALKSRENSSFF